MSPFAWLIGLLLPVCAASGAGGLPVPPVMDMAKIERPATPNTALAGPAAGLAVGPAVAGQSATMPPPDIVTPVYQVPAAQLFAAVQSVAASQPRTFVAATYPDRLQAHWVVRSAVFNFPDLVTAQVVAQGAAASTLVLYSRSVYGRSDLGVNQARLRTWLGALATMATPSAPATPTTPATPATPATPTTER
jgi:uncharacterized protein (DUF1499 family)